MVAHNTLEASGLAEGLEIGSDVVVDVVVVVVVVVVVAGLGEIGEPAGFILPTLGEAGALAVVFGTATTGFDIVDAGFFIAIGAGLEEGLGTGLSAGFPFSTSGLSPSLISEGS